MFLTILAIIINVVGILGYFAYLIFPLYGMVGPRMGASPKMIKRWRRARHCHKVEHRWYGKHPKDYDFDFWFGDWR